MVFITHKNKTFNTDKSKKKLVFNTDDKLFANKVHLKQEKSRLIEKLQAHEIPSDKISETKTKIEELEREISIINGKLYVDRNKSKSQMYPVIKREFPEDNKDQGDY